jgi:hypothetical protein
VLTCLLGTLWINHGTPLSFSDVGVLRRVWFVGYSLHRMVSPSWTFQHHIFFVQINLPQCLHAVWLALPTPGKRSGPSVPLPVFKLRSRCEWSVFERKSGLTVVCVRCDLGARTTNGFVLQSDSKHSWYSCV